MKRELIPYYLSRAVLAGLLGWVLSTSLATWPAAIVGAITFVGFIWYAHSGRYLIDPSNPFFPLRRDERANNIRDRGVVISVAVAGVTFALLSLMNSFFSFDVNTGIISLAIGVVLYFILTNWYFARG